ncbi:hypothetical protein DB31_2949 [Hyalangium minutum]|uniref:Uncharacterized protein n=1 Tax=Hyalangium minutum TaxID=394096 RepID=A0A085W5C7_9BACT|nr:hypothetical protein DB31_2949 [Hyalangium minutum]
MRPLAHVLRPGSLRADALTDSIGPHRVPLVCAPSLIRLRPSGSPGCLVQRWTRDRSLQEQARSQGIFSSSTR